MLMVTHLSGFGSGGALVQTLIDRTLGTTLGNMTGGGGLAAAFDGTTSQATAACAKTPTNGQNIGYIGKDWGASNTKTVTGFYAYSSSDNGFEDDGVDGTVTVTLQGSTDNFSSSVVDLGNASATNSNGLIISKLTGITTSTAYRYHRLKIDTSSYNTKTTICAEAQFYEDV